MIRTLLLSVAVLVAWLSWVSVSEAQVFVRAPFVRVAVDGGVSVRAPFVNLYIPPSGPAYYPGDVVYGPRVVTSPPPPLGFRSMPPAQDTFVPPAPQVVPQAQNPNGPPQPVQPAQVLTHEAFAKSFQAKAGSYEVTMLNPINKQPTLVRFTLPEGTPRRVIVDRDEIEFVYGPFRFVRIHFDRDGAIVTSR